MTDEQKFQACLAMGCDEGLARQARGMADQVGRILRQQPQFVTPYRYRIPLTLDHGFRGEVAIDGGGVSVTVAAEHPDQITGLVQRLLTACEEYSQCTS